jgi:hypothetical protein
MQLMRRSRVRLGLTVPNGGVIMIGRAAIYAHDRDDLRDPNQAGLAGSAVAAIVDWEGPVEALVHLPAAYLDEISLRDIRRDAEERLFRIREWFSRARAEIDARPESALGPVNLFTSIDNAEPYAQLETRVDVMFRARSSSKPKRTLGHVLEAGFWAFGTTYFISSK